MSLNSFALLVSWVQTPSLAWWRRLVFVWWPANNCSLGQELSDNHTGFMHAPCASQRLICQPSFVSCLIKNVKNGIEPNQVYPWLTGRCLSCFHDVDSRCFIFMTWYKPIHPLHRHCARQGTTAGFPQFLFSSWVSHKCWCRGFRPPFFVVATDAERQSGMNI